MTLFGCKSHVDLFQCSAVFNASKLAPEYSSVLFSMFAHHWKRHLKLQNIAKTAYLTIHTKNNIGFSNTFWYLTLTGCPVLSVSVTFKLPVAAHLFVCCLLASPLIICGCHHPYLTLDLSQNAMGHQRGLSPKAFLTVRVAIATGRCWGVSQSND